MSVRAREHHERLDVEVPFVDLSSQNATARAAIMSDIDGLIASGAFVNGPAVEAFEDAFARYCGTDACVGLSSGLDALRLALLAAGLEPGDEVIVPAMTFIATFEAVVQAGGVPVPVDVREDDMGIDAEAVRAVCGPRTRFVMPVHLYGQLVDVTALGEVAESHGIQVVEDACQAHGAERGGVSAGTVGLAGAFSFYPSKNLGAWGDAGALVTDDVELAAKVRALRQHGERRRYHSDAVGYTARLDALQAVVLRHKLPYLDEWNQARRGVAERYSTAFAGVGNLLLPRTANDATHVWHLYTVRTAAPERLAEHLSARGISTGRHYPEPPHLSAAFAHLGHREGAFPVAEAIGRETISLPLFPGMTAEQQDAVVEGVRSYFADA